jgi:S1-C subfamily serine protease
MADISPPTVIHELKAGLAPQAPDAPQPEVDAVTKELYEQLAPSIVKVKVDDGNGSGFIISKDGDVATDAHVVLGNRHLWVVTADGVEHKARLTKLDDINDLAILHIEDAKPCEFKPVTLGTSKDLTADQPVWALGHPKGWDPTYVSPGYFRKKETGQDVLSVENSTVQEHARAVLAGLTPKEHAEADAELKKPMQSAAVNIQKGNSGGALIDRSGKVVGITDLSNLDSNSDFTPVESLIALMEEKTPKFVFSYKKTADELVLTDISRTSGEFRRPFSDNIIVMGSSDRKGDHASPAKPDGDDGLFKDTMFFRDK